MGSTIATNSTAATQTAPVTLSVGNQSFTVNTGDLADSNLASQASSAFSLASDVFTTAVMGGPISALSTDFLKAGLSAGHQFQWQRKLSTGFSIGFTINPSVDGTVIVRKNGTVFPSSPSDISNDPTTSHKLDVPAGKAYVSIILKVSLNASGQGGFSSGNLGVKVGISDKDTFTIANHLIFDQSTPVREAIVTAFGRFVLPFGNDVDKVNSLNVGDALEAEFIGCLALSASITEGFNGLLFGAAAKSALSAAARGPLGSVLAKANPSFKLGATFEVDYTHTDAFRSLIVAQSADVIELLLFKRKTNDLAEKLDFSACVTNPLPQVLAEVIKQAASKIEAGTSAAPALSKGVSKVTAAAPPEVIKGATDAIQSAVSNFIKGLPSLGVEASVTAETIKENTVFGSFDFARPLNAASWSAAMSGDLKSALHLPGVKLGSGSFVENSLTKKTTLSFEFFGLKAQEVDKYFDDVTLTYAGNGRFQFREKVGIGASSDVFGHQGEADMYFTVEASLAEGGNVSDQHVMFFIVRKDKNAGDRSFSLGKTIALMLPSQGPAFAKMLGDATTNNPQIPVAVTAQFTAGIFSRIQATPFVGDVPQSAALGIDRENYEVFRQAVDDVVAKTGDAFPPESTFDVWEQVSRNLKNGPPNHRVSLLPQIHTSPGQTFENTGLQQLDPTRLQFIGEYIEEARRFMNLCEDLQQLSTLPPEAADTSAKLNDLVATITDIVKKDAPIFPLDFLNAVLLALTRRMQAVPTTVNGPQPSDTMKSFDLTISYS